MKDDYFTWNDAWVFTALYKSHESNDQLNLLKLIGAGDMLNHAIFTEKEIISAFEKIQTKGIIILKGYQIIFTEVAMSLIDSCEKMAGGLFSRVDVTLKKLNSNRNKYTETIKTVNISDYLKTHFEESYKNYKIATQQ